MDMPRTCSRVLPEDGMLYFIEQSASFTILQSFRPLSFAVIDTLRQDARPLSQQRHDERSDVCCGVSLQSTRIRRRLCIVIVAGFWMQGTVLASELPEVADQRCLGLAPQSLCLERC